MPKRKTVVLITGAGGYWGARLASQLLATTSFHVIGLDAEPPAEAIKGLDFIQADVRNALVEDLLRSERVAALAHLAFVETQRPSEGAFDLNVLGTMKVLGAAARAGVRQVVVPSTTWVYGAQAENSSFLREDREPKGSLRYGYLRDRVEIERFCNGFRGQAPDVTLTILRFAPIVGPQVATPLTRFLGRPDAPLLLGFDPMIQVLHADDVVEALAHALVEERPGIFNVAAERALPLWRACGLAGKLPIPIAHPLAYLAIALGRSRRFPIDPDYLRYPCVGDLERMQREFAFTPHYTAEEALREFAGRQRVRRYVRESAALSYDEERLRDTIERRRRAREGPAAGEATARARSPRTRTERAGTTRERTTRERATRPGAARPEETADHGR